MAFAPSSIAPINIGPANAGGSLDAPGVDPLTVGPVTELPSINGLATGFIRSDHPIALPRSALDPASVFAHIDPADMDRINAALRWQRRAQIALLLGTGNPADATGRMSLLG